MRVISGTPDLKSNLRSIKTALKLVYKREIIDSIEVKITVNVRYPDKAFMCLSGIVFVEH